MLEFINSFKECRLIILGKYHYFSEMLHSIENATPVETNDFWKIMAPMHHRLDSDEFNKDGKVKRHQAVKAYVAYFKKFYEANLSQIDTFLKINPNDTTLDEATTKCIFVFYITLSLYSEIGKFMINEAYSEGISQMRLADIARRKSSKPSTQYSNKDKITYQQETKMLMSHEGSLHKICTELMKILVSSKTVDSQFASYLRYHSCFITQFGVRAPITKLHYVPNTLLKKIDNQIGEINRLLLQHLKTLPVSQMITLNSKRTQLIASFGEIKLQTLAFSKEPLWIRDHQTSEAILANYQTLLRISTEVTHLTSNLLQVIPFVPPIPMSLSELPASGEITAVVEASDHNYSSSSSISSSSISSSSTSSTSTSSTSTSSSSTSSSSSSSSCNSTSHSLETNDIDLASDDITVLSQELNQINVTNDENLTSDIDALSKEMNEINLALAWDYERSKKKKALKTKSSILSSSSSSSVSQDHRLQEIAANLEKYKEIFTQLFTHRIHLVFTEKMLQKMVTLAGGSITDAEGSRKRIVIDQTASDTLSQSKIVIHQQHGPKAKSRATLPSFIVKNYRCVLQNAGLTPDKLWPLDYAVNDKPISSVKHR